MRTQCVVGLDIGGTNCRIGMVDKEYNLYHPQISGTSEINSTGNFIKELEKFTQSYIEFHKDNFEVIAISIGFPSTIDKERKTVLSTPNIAGLDNVAVVELLERHFRIPVYINRDVNMLMYHDLMHFNIPRDTIALGFYIGTGLGNAIYIHNEILLGKHGVAGELGHIPMIDTKKKCTCGNESCIEAMAAGRYLEELCEEKFPGTDIKDIYVKHGNSKELVKQVEYISIPIATEINIFDPHYIILGGGILQMEGFPFARLEENIIKHSRKPFPAQDLTILYALSEQENGIVGAGIYGYNRLKKEVNPLSMNAKARLV